jgi:hypothetical protein
VPVICDAIDSFTPLAFAGLLAAVVAVAVIAIALPLVAGFVLDGLVLLACGRGLKALVSALVFVVVLSGAGLLLLGFSRSQGPIAATPVFDNAAGMLLPWSIGFAVLAFLMRQVRRARRRR